MKSQAFLYGVIIMSFFLGACNHLFYQPDNRLYVAFHGKDGTPEESFFSTSDGERLWAWRFSARTSKRKGFVLHFHGNAQNMSAHFLYVHWLIDAGFDVLTFDYRGYGKSSGAASREGLYQDGIAALNWSRSLAKEEPLYIVAQSLGAAVAIPALHESKVKVEGLCLDSMLANYRGIARDKLASFFLTWPLQYPLSFLVSNGYNPMHYASALKIPTIVIHATKDPVTPFSQAKEFFDLMPSGSKEFWTVESDQHTVAFTSEELPYRGMLLKAWKS